MALKTVGRRDAAIELTGTYLQRVLKTTLASNEATAHADLLDQVKSHN